jgi:hypothetical protein
MARSTPDGYAVGHGRCVDGEGEEWARQSIQRALLSLGGPGYLVT